MPQVQDRSHDLLICSLARHNFSATAAISDHHFYAINWLLNKIITWLVHYVIPTERKNVSGLDFVQQRERERGRDRERERLTEISILIFDNAKTYQMLSTRITNNWNFHIFNIVFKHSLYIHIGRLNILLTVYVIFVLLFYVVVLFIIWYNYVHDVIEWGQCFYNSLIGLMMSR